MSMIDVHVELKRKLFPKHAPLDLVKLTKTSIYSMSPPDQAAIIPEIAACFYDKLNEIVITDATTNVGGNLYAMIPIFKKINAVEIDKETIQMLHNNVSLLYPQADNIIYINEDYTKLFTLEQQIIFIDPPWGGIDYRKNKDKELYMSGIPLQKLLNTEMPYISELVIVKVPAAYINDNQNKYIFTDRVHVVRKGAPLYDLLIMSNILPIKKIKKEWVVEHVNYRKYL